MTQKGREDVHKDVFHYMSLSIKFYLHIKLLELKTSTPNDFKIILSLACNILSFNLSISF